MRTGRPRCDPDSRWGRDRRRLLLHLVDQPFANPAVTVARTATDTFSGIASVVGPDNRRRAVRRRSRCSPCWSASSTPTHRSPRDHPNGATPMADLTLTDLPLDQQVLVRRIVSRLAPAYEGTLGTETGSALRRPLPRAASGACGHGGHYLRPGREVRQGPAAGSAAPRGLGRCSGPRRALRLRPQRRPVPDGGALAAPPGRRPVDVWSWCGSELALHHEDLDRTVIGRGHGRWASTSRPRSPPASASWTAAIVREDPDVVITMGCGDACSSLYSLGKRYEDWVLEDPVWPGRHAGAGWCATRSTPRCVDHASLGVEAHLCLLAESKEPPPGPGGDRHGRPRLRVTTWG